AAGSACCWSEVKEFCTCFAAFSRDCSCCFNWLISASTRLASARVVVVSRTTSTSPMSDTNKTSTVSAHGRMRLLNGLEARLRLLFTGRKSSLRAYRQAKLSKKRIHGLTKQSQMPDD